MSPRLPVLAVASALSLGACASVPAPGTETAATPTHGASAAYAPSASCRNCHKEIFLQHDQSMHTAAYSNPVFQAQYFGQLMPLAKDDEKLRKEADACIACHAPVAFMSNRGRHVTSREQVDPKDSGVTCDFCHRITGFAEGFPRNGNFVASPGDQKFGPLPNKDDWHHVFLDLQTRSEFCGICHDAVNQRGALVKSTYTEWKESPYAAKGVQCQDCHMKLEAFVSKGDGMYTAGDKLVSMGQGAKRVKLYTHRFPGAYADQQTKDAAPIDLIVDKTQPIAPGQPLALQINVRNEKAGHHLPTGSSEIRLMWLEVFAEVNGLRLPVPAQSLSEETAYDVAGKSPWDKEVLGAEVPEGSRLYRAIYLDAEGKQTSSSFKAEKLLFDNRLKAREVRSERYRLVLPKDARGPVVVSARLVFARYLSSFARPLGLGKGDVVELSSASKRLSVR